MSATFDADLWLRVPQRQHDICGLGSPVVLASSPLQRGIVCGIGAEEYDDAGERVFVAWTTCSSGTAQDPHVGPPLPALWLALDLAEMVARNRAASWLALRHGIPSGTTAPTWDMGEAAWRLAGDERTCLFVAELSRDEEATLRWLGGLAKRVPALATLNPADPRRLADGSRWVDARALVLACEAVP